MEQFRCPVLVALLVLAVLIDVGLEGALLRVLLLQLLLLPFIPLLEPD